MDKNMDVWLDNKIVWKHISLNRMSFGLIWNTETFSQPQSVQYCPSQKENKSESEFNWAILLSEYLHRRMLSKTKGE